MESKHISEQSRDKFETQVNSRIEILKLWSKDGIPWETDSSGAQVRDNQGELVAVFVPRFMEEFIRWSRDNYKVLPHPAIAGFESFGRTTLNRDYHAELKAAAAQAIELTQTRLKVQIEAANKAGIIKALELEVSYLKSVIAAQERENRESRMSASEAMTARRERDLGQRRNVEHLQEQLAIRDTRIAELTALLAKLSPLNVRRPK